MADESTPESNASAPATGGTPEKSDCSMGMLAHLLGIFTGFLGPLIIWLIKKDDSEFVNDQGKEALNFQITLLIVYIACGVLACITFGIGGLLVPIIWIVSVIFMIMAAIAANKGERYRYPVCLRLIK